ncbi:MAG TPA: helix-hairpin-helix domain-containing protein [Polyangiaceae bacterium]|jgi:competence protein ComEA
MLALSGVGVASMLKGVGGVPVPLAGMLGADIHTAWLANKSAAGPRAVGAANAASAASAASALTAQAPVTALTTNSAEPGAAAPTDGHDAAREGAKPPPSAGMTDDGKVILNLAGVEDLRHLPGVGPKRAEAILALRARLGHFKQVNDLLRVKGIGVRGLKKIMPHVVLDAPKASA